MEKQNEGLGRTGYEYETLMNLLQVSVSKHLLNEHFTVIWANDYYYDLIDYSREEYESVFRNQCDLYYSNEKLGIHDDVAWKQISDKVIETLGAGGNGYSIISQMRRKKGEYIWVRMTAKFTDEYIDGCQVAYTAMTDISDVMQMQLEQSVTYDNLPGFVGKFKVSKDLEFSLLEANKRFFDFFGDDSIKNMEYPLFRENVRRNMSAFLEHKEAMIKGEPVHFTVQMGNRFGKDAWLQINASCVGYQDGDPIYFAIYIDVTNVTELRQMQKQLEAKAEQLREALKEAEEANRAKSDFLSRMSHDIRTPLNAVLGMKDIADNHLDDKAKVKDCLKKIGLSGQHLLGLINDVLDMSKIESGEMVLREDVVSLPEVLENIVTIMQPQFKEKGQQFSIRLQGVAHEQFLGDALRLRQIFLNILSNANKFTPVDGKISMVVRELSSDSGVARFTFTVTDTGIGMQPQFLEHLFDAFSRERDSRVDKTEGTGLGMAITKKIIDLLGGTVEVKSVVGQGTSFDIALPMKIVDIPLTEESFPNLNILVADDDAILCEYTVELLRSIGIYADWVNSGAEAIEKLEDAGREGRTYDAVLLDWRMPGQDGLETTRRVRELRGDKLPVLIISSYDWNDIERDATEAGVTGFLQKPIFVSTLVHGLRRYVLGDASDEEGRETGIEADFSKKRILLVEDNVFNQEVASELLADMGAAVDLAQNGKEGVEAFTVHEAGYYDIILMDIQMPLMNGYEATKLIRAMARKDAKSVPILAMTADAFAEDIQAARAAGMNGHLAKPLDKVTLKREVGKYLKLK